MILLEQIGIGDDRFNAIIEASGRIGDTIDKMVRIVEPHKYIVYNEFINNLRNVYLENVKDTCNRFQEDLEKPVLDVVENYQFGETAESNVKHFIRKWSKMMEVACACIISTETLPMDVGNPYIDEGTGDDLLFIISSLYNDLTNNYCMDREHYSDEGEIVSIVDTYTKSGIDIFCESTQNALAAMTDVKFKISDHGRATIRKAKEGTRFYVKGEGLSPAAKLVTSVVGIGASSAKLMVEVAALPFKAGLGPEALFSVAKKAIKTYKSVWMFGSILAEMRVTNLMKSAYMSNLNEFEEIFEKYKSAKVDRDYAKKQYENILLPRIGNTDAKETVIGALLSWKAREDEDKKLAATATSNLVSVGGYGIDMINSMRSGDVSSVIKNAGRLIGAGEKLFDNAITISKGAYDYLCTHLGVKDFKFDQKIEQLRHEGEIILGHIARLGERHREYLAKINAGTLQQSPKSIGENEQGLYKIFGRAKVLRAASDITETIYNINDIIVDVKSLFAARAG